MVAVFRFYSGSKDALPGLGTGESLDEAEIWNRDGEWRKALGNDFQFPIGTYESATAFIAATAKSDPQASKLDILRQAILLKFVSSPPESLPHQLLHSKDMQVFAAIKAMSKSDLGRILLELKPKESYSKYNTLAMQHPNFRKILSNFYLFDMLDSETGLIWPSVEHWFHAHKMQLVTRKSINEIHSQLVNLEPAQVKLSTSRKRLPMTEQLLREWDKNVKSGVMEKGLLLKFVRSGTSSLPFRVLVETHDAVLQHVSRGVPGDAFGLGRQIMKVRKVCMSLL